jgi:hypothetical protein
MGMQLAQTSDAAAATRVDREQLGADDTERGGAVVGGAERGQHQGVPVRTSCTRSCATKCSARRAASVAPQRPQRAASSLRR